MGTDHKACLSCQQQLARHVLTLHLLVNVVTAVHESMAFFGVHVQGDILVAA